MTPQEFDKRRWEILNEWNRFAPNELEDAMQSFQSDLDNLVEEMDGLEDEEWEERKEAVEALQTSVEILVDTLAEIAHGIEALQEVEVEDQ